MVLFGVNFNAYYYLLLRQFKKTVMISEIWVYFGMLFAATALMFLNVRTMYAHAGDPPASPPWITTVFRICSS